MENAEDTHPAVRYVKPAWLKYAIIALIFEKIVQHIVVIIAFYLNWNDIRSTVAIEPGILMYLGALVAILFVLALWETITGQRWAINLVIGLALFDIIGEFVAQGKFMIEINVSFLVATLLLIMALIYRRQVRISRSVS